MGPQRREHVRTLHTLAVCLARVLGSTTAEDLALMCASVDPEVRAPALALAKVRKAIALHLDTSIDDAKALACFCDTTVTVANDADPGAVVLAGVKMRRGSR